MLSQYYTRAVQFFIFDDLEIGSESLSNKSVSFLPYKLIHNAFSLRLNKRAAYAV